MNRILSKHIFVFDDIEDNQSSSQAQEEAVDDDDEEEDDDNIVDEGKNGPDSVVDNNTEAKLEETAKQLEEVLTSEED